MYDCTICLQQIVNEASENSAGDHAPEFHIVYAYHRPKEFWIGMKQKKIICISDNEDWPCPTYLEYQDKVKEYTSVLKFLGDISELKEVYEKI